MIRELPSSWNSKFAGVVRPSAKAAVVLGPATLRIRMKRIDSATGPVSAGRPRRVAACRSSFVDRNLSTFAQGARCDRFEHYSALTSLLGSVAIKQLRDIQ